MIRLDLGALSENQLKDSVVRRCSMFGTVVNVTIVQRLRYPFALAAVEMRSAEEALEVLRSLGDSKVDDMVVIRIENNESFLSPLHHNPGEKAGAEQLRSSQQ